MTYTYLADGTKVSARILGGEGLRYSGSFVYAVSVDGSETLESVGWDEGRIIIGSDGTAGQDQWFVRDHLGNVRSVVDLSAPEGSTAETALVEQSDYLPFGTRIAVTTGTDAPDNRYRYAGKEEQRFGTGPFPMDLEHLDFGARFYDPFTARWTTTDPLAAKYPSISPYAYCGNDPINRVDPDGRIWDTVIDVAFLAYDVTAAVVNKVNGNDDAAKQHLKDAGSDIIFAVIPGASAGYGKALKLVDKGLDATKTAEKTADAVKAVNKAGDTFKTISNVSDSKGIAKDAFESGSGKLNQTGSYTITFESGKEYHGKGPTSRMKQSAREKAKEYADPVVNMDWTPSSTQKDAFIDEAKRIRSDGGVKNPNNYNKINSPGEKYLK